MKFFNSFSFAFRDLYNGDITEKALKDGRFLFGAVREHVLEAEIPSSPIEAVLRDMPFGSLLHTVGMAKMYDCINDVFGNPSVIKRTDENIDRLHLVAPGVVDKLDIYLDIISKKDAAGHIVYCKKIVGRGDDGPVLQHDSNSAWETFNRWKAEHAETCEFQTALRGGQTLREEDA